MITVDEARTLVLDLASAPQTEDVALHEALGRALAAPAVARLTQPPFNASAMDQRADVMALNSTLKADLEKEGFVFNDVDPKPFEDKLREAGFYAEWKKTYGDEAWAILEAAIGRKLV